MIKEVADRQVVAAYVQEVRARLLQGKHDDAAHAAATAWNLDTSSPHESAQRIAKNLPTTGPGEETEPPGVEPFISRDPLVSLIQTTLATRLHQNDHAGETLAGHPHHGVFSHIWADVTRFFDKARLTERGAQLAAEVAEGMLQRLAAGTHAFNEATAEHTIDENNTRLIVVGDWGSGLEQAKAVGNLMAEQVTQGLEAGRAVHVIHLGDVYFAGEAEEYRDHALDWWPVTPAQADAGAGSWALAGNHDLYGGAHAYFTVMLADPRFKLQQSDGKPTSWFRLRSPSWDIIGLDTSWNNDPFASGQTGVLEPPQAARLEEWTTGGDGGGKDGPKRMLLTHHQFLTAYDTRLKSVLDAGQQPVLHQQIMNVVNDGAITAWIWGHEHRCMAFEDKRIAFPRCLGHGGQLQQANDGKTPPPAPGTWEETAHFNEAGTYWNSFGFVVLDLDGPQIHACYHLDGAQPATPAETFS